MNPRRRHYYTPRLAAAITGYVMLPLVGLSATNAILPPPAAAAASRQAEGIAKASVSSLVSSITLPPGALRSTVAEHVSGVVSGLNEVAAASPEKGKVKKAEVLMWRKDDRPRDLLPQALESAGFSYRPQSTTKNDKGLESTNFFAVNAKTKSRLIGVWMEDDSNVMLAWGIVDGGSAPAAADAADAAPEEETLPSPVREAPKKAKAPASPAAAAARGKAPADMLGNWGWTTISGVNYVNTTTNQLSSPSGMSAKFTFLPNGRFKYFFFIRQQTYSLVTQSATTQEGTVKFNGDGTFTMHTEKGHYNGFTGSRIIDRDMTEAERSKPQVYQYEWRTDDSCNRQLYIGPTKNSLSHFKREK
jgi:hypothetical protein